MKAIKNELKSINQMIRPDNMSNSEILFLKQRVDFLSSKVKKIAKKHNIDLSDIYGA